jgi:hypothetical protein
MPRSSVQSVDAPTHTISVLGIRHHGPGSARMVLGALQALDPDCVLVEGPADAEGVLRIASHEQMVPPVALLVYEPDEPRHAAYYPFATFSPEWHAIRWALESDRSLSFIDLPWSARGPSKPDQPERADGPDEDDNTDEAGARGSTGQLDPLESLVHAAGFADGEHWWGRLIEERRGEGDPFAVFDAIRGAMATAREQMQGIHRDADEPVREAHMRRCIRGAIKKGFTRIAVVCGAWHAPMLTRDALDSISAKADDAILKNMPKRKTAATWIPWTHDRLAMSSGYGAGVASPGWYEHLWIHHSQIAERWMTRVARLMRDEDLDASPASVIEAVRLAEALATMRGRSMAGLDELGEATLAVLCHGNPLPLHLIEARLIVGQRLGSVPEDAPAVPLQRDLLALQKSLRMKVSADESVLDLDQRKEIDLSRSRLLHRLRLLDIPWGTRQEQASKQISTFHEVWKLQWKPEFAVAIIEAARWGNTVEEAVTAYATHRAQESASLAELTTMLDDAMLADLPRSVSSLLARIRDISAVGADMGHLMDALPPLARILRYGNVRRADAALVSPVVAALLARVCVGILPACASLDDDAAGAMRSRLDAVHGSLATLELPHLHASWTGAMRALAHASIHGLVAGRAARHLLDDGHTSPEAAAIHLSMALSPGQDPEKASAWLEGFLAGSGMVLVHDARLLSIIDGWVCGLTRDTFERVCPVARRTFSTFEAPERRLIGQTLRSAVPAPGNTDHAGRANETRSAGDGLDAARSALVDTVLRLIFGNDALEEPSR